MKGVLARLRRPEPAECESVRGLMSDYVDGELQTEGNEQVEAHTGVCPRCRRVLSNLRLTLARVTLLRQSPPAGVENIDGVTERISASWRDRR